MKKNVQYSELYVKKIAIWNHNKGNQDFEP